jgi:DNA-binding Lrp family transcriptional regulator
MFSRTSAITSGPNANRSEGSKAWPWRGESLRWICIALFSLQPTREICYLSTSRTKYFIAMPATLDSFDRKILDIVQVDNLVPHRKISEAIGLSVPAVARRLQRLRKEGVIAADASVLRQETVGIPITIVVHVAVESEVVGQLDDIRARFRACPQVQQCYYVTGEVDFILVIAVRDMEEYQALTRSLFFEGGNVRRFRTFVAMERVKMSLRVPLNGR